jgi:hypothetical protein
MAESIGSAKLRVRPDSRRAGTMRSSRIIGQAIAAAAMVEALGLALAGSAGCGSSSAGGNPGPDAASQGSDGGSDASPPIDGGAEAGADATTPPDGGVVPKGTPMGEFLGVNGFIDDPIDRLAPIGTVREYHNWGWLADNFAAGPAYPNMLYTFMNFNGWDWDMYFAGIKAAGAAAFPAVQGGVPWIDNGAVPPIAQGADKTVAASYVAHGDVMFQFAARYGSVKVADSKLKLKANQTRVSGLGTVQYFEDFNEQDNAPGFTGDAFAAMASADYDGDQQRLGDTIGIKNADPNAELVMGGLSGAYPTANGTWVKSITVFLDAMRAWSTAHRAGSFPADVLNVHLYSFGPGGAPPAPAISPEADGVKAKLAAVVAYRDQYLPGKQVWWTEFGYDTFDQSPLHAPAVGGNSAEVVQGQWLVRAFLAGVAAGMDRATLFVLRDSCHTNDVACQPQQQFNTCGLTTIKGEWTPKPSWFFLATVRARLATMVYAGEQPSGDPNVTVYRFKDTQSAGGALVVWSPTSSANTVPGYGLVLPAGASTAKEVLLVDQQANGTEQALTPSGGRVTIDVSETPAIVLVDAMP